MSATLAMRVPQYWRHVLTVLGGALGAQALPLLVAPLVTRLCTPSDFGAFSVWFGVVSVAAIVATLRMETAMILDHGPVHQRTCFGVVAWCASVCALALTVLAVSGKAFGVPMVRQLSWFGLLTLGAGTWLLAMQQTTLAYATSHNRFGKAARAKVWGAATIAVAQVGLSLGGGGAIGLIAAQLLGLIAGLLTARALLSPPQAYVELRLTASQRRYLHRHQKFWRFALPSNLLNALVGQLPLFLIGVRHGVVAAGLFALTQRVLAAPISLLAASVLEVFKRQSVVEYQQRGNCRAAYRTTARALLMLGAGPSLILCLFSPQLFAAIFGPAWRPAGELAQLLAPLYFLNFIASPLSYVFFVTGKQKMELLWQIALFSMTVIVFASPLALRASVLAYSIGYSLLYLVYLAMSWQCARGTRP